MLQEINELLKSINDAEVAFEKLRDDNENKITKLIESSLAYKELKEECTGDYKCWVNIYDDINIKIVYRLTNTFNRQSIVISEEGIESTCKLVENEYAKNKLIRLATKFYEEFYLEENKDIN